MQSYTVRIKAAAALEAGDILQYNYGGIATVEGIARVEPTDDYIDILSFAGRRFFLADNVRVIVLVLEEREGV